MEAMSQPDAVRYALEHEGGTAGVARRKVPRDWPVKHYLIAAGDPAPKLGSIISTVPGAYWRVMAVVHDADVLDLTVESLRPSSLEAHGDVLILTGGTLV